MTELWISYNLIEKLKGINVLKKLVVLYMANNNVKEMNEFQKLVSQSLKLRVHLILSCLFTYQYIQTQQIYNVIILKNAL